MERKGKRGCWRKSIEEDRSGKRGTMDDEERR
jgi:hypothetical protein